MYQNLKWIRDSHAQWDYYEKLDGLPVNPPGAYLAEGDVEMSQVDILNWNSDDGLTFEPRLRDRVQDVHRGPVRAGDDEAPELDYDMGYDCD